MSGNKRKRDTFDSTAPRVGSKVPNLNGLQVGRPSSQFHYDTGRGTGGKLQHQVKYGPGIGFTSQQRGQLHTHYNDPQVTSRYTQYNANRSTYVNAAVRNQRGLTLQEVDVQQGRDPGPTSINHIIASGTGQHALNQTTLEFNAGGKIAGATTNPLTKMGGIAQQAAAIGRMRGLAREVLREETRTEGYGSILTTGNMTEAQGFVAKRNQMGKDLHKAFESGDVNSYKRFLKHTFDSTGNLRLGDASGNSRVSTGFDMPLDRNLQPTPRGQRLLETYKTFGYSNMMTEGALTKRNNSGIFTTNLLGSKLSSSKQ